MENTDPQPLSPRAEHYNDILTTAIEGGVQYWATIKTYEWEGRSEPFAVIMDCEEDDPKEHTVSPATIAKGLNLLRSGAAWGDGPVPEWWVRKWRTAYNECADGSWDFDAGDADVIVQAGLFGEVVYG